MGLFSKKPSAGNQVFSEYADVMRLWMERLQRAREAGANITTVSEAVDAAGDVPPLGLQRLPGSVDRDLALATARAWINMEADRLSRKDLLRGSSERFWQELADALWSAIAKGIKKTPSQSVRQTS
jgi:hypothetical protein